MKRAASRAFAWPFIVSAILLILLLLPLTAGLAQEDGPTDNEVNAIAKQLYCPVCENIPLDVCGTQACVQWRSLIREKLAEGWTEAEIKNYFVEQYGDRVLAVPPPSRGLNWLVYVLPPLAFLAGAVVLFRAVRSWQRPKDAPPAEEEAAATPEDPYVAQLEEELSARKGETKDLRSTGAEVDDG